MKKFLLLLFAFFILIPSYTQSRLTADDIMNSGHYLYGIGQGSSYREADNNALDLLISQITVQVESYFENKTTDREGDIKTFAQSVVRSYSNVSIESAKSMLLEERRGKFEVLRYISLQDLDRLFENRKNKIKAYIRSGMVAETDLRIGDALKNYYWALVLLQSHKDRDNITFDFPETGERLLSSALPEIINNIFTDLDFTVRSVDERPTEKYKAINLNITYNNEPVDNLEYYVWQGTGYSKMMSTRSGIGLAEFYGDVAATMNVVKLNVEYEYSQKTTFDLEVDAVFKNIRIPYMDRCEFEIRLPSTFSEKPKAVELETRKLEYEKLNKVEKSRQIRKKVSQVVDAIQFDKMDEIGEIFTAEGMAMFRQLFSAGQVKVLPFADTLRVVHLDDETMVRSVPMRFSYQENSRDFIEQVVFSFDKEQKISALSFAISDKAISDIVSRSNRFGSTEDKYQLIGFLEHYKTAYCLKRLSYIESVFADNALIIVGHVVKAAEPIDGMYAMAGNDQVQYIELSKSAYLERLRKVFNSNEFVNIHFEDNIVKKVNGDSKIYGIQIKQDYLSATYADKGYLFLMIDLNDSLNPKIYVRTWQPERNPDGSIFGLDDFFVN